MVFVVGQLGRGRLVRPLSLFYMMIVIGVFSLKDKGTLHGALKVLINIKSNFYQYRVELICLKKKKVR